MAPYEGQEVEEYKQYRLQKELKKKQKERKDGIYALILGLSCFVLIMGFLTYVVHQSKIRQL